ncbi:hypothetical protein OG292_02895 [Streptomyces sp. NBC_01511]|uniref:hypothetical protein n=1 Tax=unclassified Streptomyces TaxID=2593676 RepID=UPI003867AD8C
MSLGWEVEHEKVDLTLADKFRIEIPTGQSKAAWSMWVKPGNNHLEGWHNEHAGKDWTNHFRAQELTYDSHAVYFTISCVGGQHDGWPLVVSPDGKNEVCAAKGVEYSRLWWAVGIGEGSKSTTLTKFARLREPTPWAYVGKMGWNERLFDAGYVGYADVLPPNTREWTFAK